jgi:hypothetical protein
MVSNSKSEEAKMAGKTVDMLAWEMAKLQVEVGASWSAIAQQAVRNKVMLLAQDEDPLEQGRR